MIGGNARLELRCWVAQSPSLYRAVLLLSASPRRHTLASHRSEIVVDGFPRSGNTYAVSALMAAQSHETRIARHVHLPVQFELAKKYAIPAVLLVRHPVDAAVSLLIREPALSPEHVMRRYVIFHEQMEEFRASVVVGTFRQVVEDPYSIYRKVNHRFGTRFATPRLTPALEARIRELVLALDEQDRRGLGSGARTAGVPNAEREAMKTDVRARVMKLPQRLLTKALALYESWESK
jgi:hypothetical protein